MVDNQNYDSMCCSLNSPEIGHSSRDRKEVCVRKCVCVCVFVSMCVWSIIERTIDCLDYGIGHSMNGIELLLSGA